MLGRGKLIIGPCARQASRRKTMYRARRVWNGPPSPIGTPYPLVKYGDSADTTRVHGVCATVRGLRRAGPLAGQRYVVSMGDAPRGHRARVSTWVDVAMSWNGSTRGHASRGLGTAQRWGPVDSSHILLRGVVSFFA